MPLKRKYIFTRASLFLVALLLAAPLGPYHACAKTGSGDVVWKKTIEVFSGIPCLTSDQLDFGSEIIRGLDYNSQRVSRILSSLPGASFDLSKQSWVMLMKLNLSFEQMRIFEQWAELPGADMPIAMEALPRINTLNYVAGKTFAAFMAIPGSGKASFTIKIIPLLNKLDDANNKAAMGFFSVKDITARAALDSLSEIGTYSEKKALACAALAATKGMNLETMRDSLPLISRTRDDDAWNMRTLFLQKGMERKTAWNWLVRYFATPPPVQDVQFYQLSEADRQTLVKVFYDAGEELVWKINNLHGITDQYGWEISQAGLRRMSIKRLNGKFKELSIKTRYAYGGNFHAAVKAGNHGRVVSLLAQATKADRKQVAMELVSANIYALLAQGSELYDSSFRDILVPILKGRIAKKFQGNLLSFLKTVDPENQLVSNFIVSLAQKGKLTTFFPKDTAEQELVLDLVARSAFKDEDAILLFSATLKHLLTVLEPGARNFIVHKMVIEADKDQGKPIFSTMITVILQYYMQEYPELLDKEARRLITRAVVRHGAVDLSRYQVTPFAEWKKDRRLGSISVFHPDDDGRKSFISNARTLQKNGYRMVLSEQYTPMMDAAQRRKINARIGAARNNPGSGLNTLFIAMRDTRFSVACVKKVNGITIRHSLFVYGSKREQQELLKRFLLGGDEMFAQRGHSYWRSEQITEPLERLKELGQIRKKDLKDKQRFLSLGSCGGVKAYTHLTRLFQGHIDILATIGTGMAIINDPYNRNFFEIVAKNPSTMTWRDMADKSSFIFSGGRGQDYLQPGSLTSILHKILDEEKG